MNRPILIGYRKDSRPIYLAQGGSEDADPPADVDPSTVDDTDSGADPEGTEQLGDAGKKALNEMKAKWQAERDKRKEIEAKLAENAAPPKPDDAVDPEKIRAQARAEARKEALAERVLDKIEAKAAKVFTDPADAKAFLEKKASEFVDGDEIDLDAIDDALEDLAKRKPYMTVAAQGGKRFEGSADGGARTPPKKSTLDDLIAEAEAAKNTKLAISLKNQKLMQGK